MVALSVVATAISSRDGAAEFHAGDDDARAGGVRRGEAIESAAQLVDRMNPFSTPDGELQLAECAVRWDSRMQGPPRRNVESFGQDGPFEVAMFEVTVTGLRDGTEWFRFTAKQVGFRRIVDETRALPVKEAPEPPALASGFTLLEVLTALVIGSLLIVFVQQAFVMAAPVDRARACGDRGCAAQLDRARRRPAVAGRHAAGGEDPGGAIHGRRAGTCPGSTSAPLLSAGVATYTLELRDARAARELVYREAGARSRSVRSARPGPASATSTSAGARSRSGKAAGRPAKCRCQRGSASRTKPGAPCC